MPGSGGGGLRNHRFPLRLTNHVHSKWSAAVNRPPPDEQITKMISMRIRNYKLLIKPVLLIVLLTVEMQCNAEDWAGQLTTLQSSESFEAAIRNNSTSPSYVLIYTTDDEARQHKPTCTTATFLLGAIRREYALGYGTADVSKAAEIALASSGRIFHFQQRLALNNIVVKYSGSDLAAAREFLAPFSKKELQTKFASVRGEHRLEIGGYARDAIACALVERGLSPKLADRSGQVYVDKTLAN